MSDKPHAAPIDRTPEPDAERATIDSTFRNGSLTAIGVVVGFSLGFLSRWAGLPGDWAPSDLVAVFAITLGIGLQIKALADLLSIQSLQLVRYNRAVRIFIIGLILVSCGVASALFADLLGFGGIALKG
ncbi:hypothetical protein [Microvirga guangxiensis]|uniref:Uncharacterized protein n=1 Tax=Microvirga guangxiensis TaxID=549386 RepID=A0A1G5G564_9HYPH|nr:hypothetical protein [Microvirga guangxiensis]SCY46400.1 hypothetical protein SAMN02927923_01376 [Microvirga guangxiensis]